VNIDFEELLARSPNPYVILDPDLTLVWMNDAYLRVTMRRREEILSRRIFDAFPSDPQSESFRQLDASFRRVLDMGEPDEIALIRYDIPRPDGGMEVRYWSATHTPLPGETGAPVFILQHTVDVTELQSLRRLRDEVGIVRRASAVEARNRDLAAESRRLTDFFEQAPGFVAVLEGPEHRFGMANAAYLALVGRSDLLGQRVCDALPEVVEQGFVEVLDTVFTTAEPYVGRRQQVVLANAQDGDAAARYLNFIFQPVLNDQDEVTGIIVQGYDITEQVESEERQELLINELNHRVKNTLAVVQGLASQSFRSVPAARGAQAIFDARLKALAAAHNLLTEAHWRSALLRDVVRRSAEATAGALIDRFTLAGPRVALTPPTAVSLAMIIHEMCTNAIKYGALSSHTGRVDVDWTVIPDEGEGRVRLTWRERDGPPVAPPTSRGFGTRLIDRGMSSRPSGRVEMRFEPRGLVCVIEAALESESE
jgi:two-component sensor histidine kinase/PAS domain-containing protein